MPSVLELLACWEGSFGKQVNGKIWKALSGEQQDFVKLKFLLLKTLLQMDFFYALSGVFGGR